MKLGLTILGLCASTQAFKVSFFEDSLCQNSFMAECENCGRISSVSSQNIAATVDYVSPSTDFILQNDPSGDVLEAWTDSVSNVASEQGISDLKTISISSPNNACAEAASTAGEDGLGDTYRSALSNVDFDHFEITLYKDSSDCNEMEEEGVTSSTFSTDLEPTLLMNEKNEAELTGFKSACISTTASFVKDWFDSFHITSAYSSRYSTADINATNSFFASLEEEEEDQVAYITVEIEAPHNDIVKLNGPNAVTAGIDGHWVQTEALGNLKAANFIE